MKKIYGIFSGEYSDWNVHGFFEDKIKAEKYCAYQNCDYYVLELGNIESGLTMNFDNVKLLYEHEIVFDFKFALQDIEMRKEPERYRYYTGKLRPNFIDYNKQYGWISFHINTDSSGRNKAEKIAQDLYFQFKYYYAEDNDFDNAIKRVKESKLLLGGKNDI